MGLRDKKVKNANAGDSDGATWVHQSLAQVSMKIKTVKLLSLFYEEIKK